MIFVTTAKGETHRAHAARLAESFRKWKWPKLYIIADERVSGFDTILASDDHEAGRGLKTRFAHYLPPVTGNVFFIDADCEAVGEFVAAPDIESGQVSGIARQTYPTKIPRYLLCSACLGFHNLDEAKAACDEWGKYYQDLKKPSDEPALYRVTRTRNVIPHGTKVEPLKNLKHHLVTSSQSARYARWFDFRDVYDMASRKTPENSVIVEVGVWQGQSLKYLSEKANAQVIGYDQFDPDYYLGTPEPNLSSDEWLTKVTKHCDKATVISSDSVAAASRHADGSVWFVFLDAGHTEEQLLADIAAWIPKIAKGGILAGHDLDHPRHPGVRVALEKSGLDWKPISRSSWICYCN